MANLSYTAAQIDERLAKTDDIGDLTELETTDKDNLVDAINELFTDVGDGKTLIAAAITDKGVATAATDSFSTMAQNIEDISSGGNIETSRAYTVSSSGNQTISPDTGYDAMEEVALTVPAGTEGTPTATKGAVNNHAISITPSVTNSGGWIAGGTKTGTAVSVSASEVVSGTYNVSSSGTKDVTNYASASVPAGSATAASTISATGASVSTGTNTLTLSKSVSNTPQVSAGYVSAGTAGNSSVSLTASVTTKAAATIHPSTSDQTISSGTYLTGAQTVKAVSLTNLSADNIKSGVTVKVGDSTDDDCVASVTGTYSGGGGTSKNVQIAAGVNRVTTTTLAGVSGQSITVSKTGTYDIYWGGYRSSTSGTSGSQLYKNSAAYGTENTSFSNHGQSVHLTNVSLVQGDVIQVYARSRGTNYYMYVSNLTIIEA